MEINSLRDVQKLLLWVSDSIDDYYDICDELYRTKQELAKYKKQQDDDLKRNKELVGSLLKGAVENNGN